jgi:hypothetical protein
VVIPDWLVETALGLSLLSVKARFILSLSLYQNILLKIFIYFNIFYRVFFTSKKYLQKTIAGKLLIELFGVNFLGKYAPLKKGPQKVAVNERP